MRVTMSMNYKAFNKSCEAAISKVGRGSRKATVEACRIISDESLAQVPYETGTLARSQFWEVTGSYKTGFEGTIGYGGNGDPINPVTGKSASSYMVAVHEDLDALHIIGKAKFLEDPIRDFARERFPRTVIKYVDEALNT